MKKKVLGLVLSTVMVLSMLSGCGSAGTSTESTDGGEATEGNIVVIAKNEDAETLDPALQVCSGGIQVQAAIGEGLVRATEDGQDVEACLASDWTVSEDGLTYTFNLVPDVKFSDGNDVTLEDWQFTFERAATAEGSYWNYVAEDIEEVTQPEENVLEIKLKAPSACFLAKLAMFPMYVQEKAHYEEVGDEDYAANGAIMTGPFAVQEYKPGEYLMLTKNENYREDIAIDGVKFQIVTDDNSRVTMLQAGDIDVAENVPTSNYDEINDSDGVSVQTFNSTLTKYLILNTKDDILSDVNVRKAISLAINKDDIVTMALNGYGEAAASYMSRYGMFYDEKMEEHVNETNIEEAKKLLKEAGYEDGFDLEVLVPAGDSAQSAIVTILQSQLKEVGINVTENALDDSAYKDTKYDMKHQSCIATWIDDMIDPDGLNGYWWDTSINNAYYSGFESDESNELYAKTKTELDNDARADEFAQLQELYYENVVSIPLYNAAMYHGISDNVSGLKLTPLGVYYNMAGITK